MVLGMGAQRNLFDEVGPPPLPLDISYYLYSIIHLDRYRCIHEYGSLGRRCNR